MPMPLDNFKCIYIAVSDISWNIFLTYNIKNVYMNYEEREIYFIL